jgi:hypothetical protein
VGFVLFFRVFHSTGNASSGARSLSQFSQTFSRDFFEPGAESAGKGRGVVGYELS